MGADGATQVVDLATLPAPGPQDYASGRQADVVRPLDTLNIAVFGVPELTRTVRVSNGGFFDFPLIGAVQANGRSLAEVGFELESRLGGTYVREPDVTVEMEGRPGQVFTVAGEVNNPGQFAIIQPTTLMQTIAIAGGRTDLAQEREVLIFREVGGQRYIGVYDMTAIERGNYADPEVYAHDIVMVGDSPGRRLITDLLTYTQLLSTPLVLLQQAGRF